MTDINKQKFLMELSKLLTFMYEEDRQNALALYSRMFDKAEDEIALLQLLVSPTRQAVIVARAYNAREHKLEVQSHTREAGAAAPGGELPDYVRAINQIHQTAVSQRIIAPDVTSGQFTLFSDDDSGLTEAYRYDDAGPAWAPAPSASFQTPVQPPVPAQAPAPAPAPVQAPVQPPSPPPFVWEETPAPAPVPSVPVAETPVPAPVEEEPQPAPAAPAFVPPEVPVPAAPAYPEEAPAPEEPEAFPVEEEPAAVPVPDFQEEAYPVSVPEEEPLTQSIAQGAAVGITPEQPVEEPEYEEEEEPRRKPRIFLLILYVLIAAPLTVLGVLVLLIPTALCLALAAAVLAAGGLIFAAAFSGFNVLADILVVLGIALIVLALGLFCLWIFVWFIGGAIFGLVRGVINLGSRWCFKEVPAV